MADRLSMLKKLSFIGKDQLNVFTRYIPDHYDKIYTLYNILSCASIDYKNINFFEPTEEDDSFIFLCEFTKSGDCEIFENYINNNSQFRILRNSPLYTVKTEKLKNGLSKITFEVWVYNDNKGGD